MRAVSLFLAAFLYAAVSWANIGPVIYNVTVSDLPSACDPSRPYWVTDGASATDCSVGGGSTIVLCVCDAAGTGYNSVASASTISGSGTAGYIPEWSSTSGLTDSSHQEVGTVLVMGGHLGLYAGSIPGTCSASEEGEAYYDDNLNEPCFCNGSTWTPFDGSGTCGAAQNWTNTASSAWTNSAASAWTNQ